MTRKYIFSKEHREKLSRAKIGTHLSEKTKKKMSEARRKNPIKYWLGKKDDQCFNWKGEKASYNAIHMWVRKHLGTAKKCKFCGKEWSKPKSIQWANKDHKYKRVLKDWIPLCVSCHKKFDLKK